MDQRLADHHEADEQARRCRPGEEGGRQRRPGREQQHEGGDAGQQPARGHVPQRPDEEGGHRQDQCAPPHQEGVGTGGHGRHPPIRADRPYATPDRGLAISRRSRGRHRAARQPRLAPEKQSPTMRLSRSASMTLSPVRPDGTRALLPMAGRTHGNRSAVTCHLRCGDACFKEVPNTTRDRLLPRRGRDRVVASYGPRRRGRRCRHRGLRPADLGARHRRPPRDRPREGSAPDRAGVRRHRSGRHDGRRRDGAGRLPLGPDHPLGRPGHGEGAGVRPGRPGPPGAGPAVRLQLRLPRHHRDRPQGHPRAAGGQPRVHQRGHHVPADHVGGGEGPHRVGRARHVGRRAASPARGRAVALRAHAAGSTAGSPSTPSSPSTARPPARRCCRPRRTPPAPASAAP